MLTRHSSHILGQACLLPPLAVGREGGSGGGGCSASLTSLLASAIGIWLCDPVMRERGCSGALHQDWCLVKPELPLQLPVMATERRENSGALHGFKWGTWRPRRTQNLA